MKKKMCFKLLDILPFSRVLAVRNISSILKCIPYFVISNDSPSAPPSYLHFTKEDQLFMLDKSVKRSIF